MSMSTGVDVVVCLCLQVAKNRFDGELGIMLLKFNKDTKSFASPSPSDGKQDTPSRGSDDSQH